MFNKYKWNDRNTTRDLVKKFNELVDYIATMDNKVEASKHMPSIQKFVIGDGKSTSFVLNHNLGTRDIIVQIAETESPYEVVLADIKKTSPNTITIEMKDPPIINQYTVYVLG